MIRRIHDVDGGGEVGRDPELSSALGVFDPASRDPTYWLRFRSWVMSGAARELARRRMAESLTVGDVMQSWARALVPTAALAAALAGLLLLRGDHAVAELPAIGVEELLVSDIEGNTIPNRVVSVSFAAEGF